MCTVTFIPNSSGYVFTSNRDESPDRSSNDFPITQVVGDKKVYFPKDAKANGTWIALSERGDLVCLLNGGFEKHQRVLPYRKSRGIIVLERFEFDSFNTFASTIDLDNIEPFTLISVESNCQVTELVWDGAQKHISVLDTDQRHIWSSSTLYPAPIKQTRTELFKSLRIQSAEEALHFHQKGAPELGVENQIRMKRDRVETISTTQIRSGEQGREMEHFNYLTEEMKSITI